PGPLARVASGGELSRFMLALKVVLAAAAPVPTLVFDEVDAGVGGATAAAVGERLARLAIDVQVLVVTHSPQVAALAAHHWRVEKRQGGGAVLTRVEELAPAGRREEIARMLSGAVVTDEARAAAARLMAGAG
ncbi:MAG TPA: DNA repair protein RecN, partial [Dongiaceae bacterium]|nr:DNA repair protein RecN [Dongiaceae bacterium]